MKFSECLLEVVAMLKAGLIRPSELPAVSQRLLECEDAPDLVGELATTDGAETRAVARLLAAIMDEAQVASPSDVDALRICARRISRSILSGEMGPAEGAAKLRRATLYVNARNFHELDGFIYAAREIEGRPGDAAFFDRAIVEEAKRWV
jgi:hypothetical protein